MDGGGAWWLRGWLSKDIFFGRVEWLAILVNVLQSYYEFLHT